METWVLQIQPGEQLRCSACKELITSQNYAYLQAGELNKLGAEVTWIRCKPCDVKERTEEETE